MDRDSPIVLSPYVTLEQGTGLVHTAPGHGAEDYEIGQKYGLETLAPVDDGGVFTKDAGQFAGQFVFKANKPIVEHLRAIGALAGHAEVKHSYPHCWRCKNPIIFRAVEQWFIALDHRGLRQSALDEVRKVKWVPQWGENRIRGHDRAAAGLVHLAAARVGRAVAVPGMRRLRQVDARPRADPEVPRAGGEGRRRYLV